MNAPTGESRQPAAPQFPTTNDVPATNEAEGRKVLPDYRRPVVLAVLQQVFVLFALALADFGHGDLLFICVRTVPAFWSGVILIWLRRRQSPAAADLRFIRWGYVPLCVTAILITEAVWLCRGLE